MTFYNKNRDNPANNIKNNIKTSMGKRLDILSFILFIRISSQEVVPNKFFDLEPFKYP